MKIKILRSFGAYTAGETLEIDAEGGIPKQLFWRRRLRDAKRDGCLEVVKEKASKNKPKVKPEANEDADNS